MSYHSIAIDGPAGAGKSTLARLLAAELGFLYVDTGAIYRTVGLFAHREGADLDDPQAVAETLPRLEVGMDYGPDGLQRMYLNGEDVTRAIRDNEVSQYASRVSAVPAVRGYLLEMQRRLAREHDVIMDGRDIGTVVLPQAELKVFLTADARDRARRRYEELMERGQRVEFGQILKDVEERDARDTQREISPLRKAEDAVELDTTGDGQEESFRRLLELVRARLAL